jgi:hypothetical protein
VHYATDSPRPRTGDRAGAFRATLPFLWETPVSKYSLNLQIDSQSLSMLRAAGQRITLGRFVNGATPNVSWLVFNPFMSNSVTWEDQYGLYASTASLMNGATITQMSAVSPPARDASTYRFLPSMTFSGPTPGGVPAGSYGIQNNAPPSGMPTLTFGLTQSAVVNGAGTAPQPVSATAMISNMMAVVTPNSSICVWLQSMYGSSTFIGNIMAPTTKVTYGGNVTSQTLAYDPNRGVFVPASMRAGESTAEDHIEISEPSLY